MWKRFPRVRFQVICEGDLSPCKNIDHIHVNKKTGSKLSDAAKYKHWRRLSKFFFCFFFVFVFDICAFLIRFGLVHKCQQDLYVMTGALCTSRLQMLRRFLFFFFLRTDALEVSHSSLSPLVAEDVNSNKLAGDRRGHEGCKPNKCLRKRNLG